MSYLLSTENFAKVGEFIYRNSGINLEEEKHYHMLAKFIDGRIKDLKIDNFKEYFFKLRFENTKEFQILINAITVNETYFFREKVQFEVLVNKILPELNELLPKDKPIRILSAPCSSGEEPYSILIHILEEKNFIKNRKIEIVGIDIDSNVIEKAKNAKYSQKSVNAIPEDILSKYFSKKSSEYTLCKDIKQNIDFDVVNIFDKIQMKELGRFDVIFSRNMFIYFDDESRKKVAMTFYDILNQNGYILLGDAEKMGRIVSVFNPKNVNDTLIYQK